MMAKIIVQDGIYWVRDYPYHPASQMLMASLPGYERFAIRARHELDQHQQQLQGSQIDQLTAAAAAAFNYTTQRLDAAQASNLQHQQMSQAMQAQLADMYEYSKSSYELQKKTYDMQQTMYNYYLQQQANPSQQVPVALPPLPPAPAPPRLLPNSLPAAPARRLPNSTGAGTGQVMTIRSNPRCPPINTAMPKSIELLVREWQREKLDDYASINNKSTDWGSKMHQAYIKRKYIHDFAHRTKGAGSTVDRAKEMDRSRIQQKLTVAKYFTLLKSNDDDVRRRPSSQGRSRGTRTSRASGSAGRSTGRRSNPYSIPGHRTAGERMLAAGMNQVAPRVTGQSAAAQARMAGALGFLDELGLGRGRSATNGGSNANVDV